MVNKSLDIIALVFYRESARSFSIKQVNSSYTLNIIKKLNCITALGATQSFPQLISQNNRLHFPHKNLRNCPWLIYKMKYSDIETPLSP